MSEPRKTQLYICFILFNCQRKIMIALKETFFAIVFDTKVADPIEIFFFANKEFFPFTLVSLHVC